MSVEDELATLKKKVALYEQVHQQIDNIIECIELYHDGCACKSRMLELKAVMTIRFTGQAVYCQCLHCGFDSLVFTAGAYKPTPGKFECYECFMVRTGKLEPMTKVEDKSQKLAPVGHNRFELLDYE